MNAVLADWVPAVTENARVSQNPAIAVPDARTAGEIHEAIERVRRFEAQVLREAEDRPLMIIDRP